jgi:ribosome biogenesis GTPase A
MSIQWYPGHMHKARKELKAALAKVDLVIEIVDARLPFSSENPLLRSLRGNKPCIKLLNKADLADPQITRLWQEYLNGQQVLNCYAVSKNNPGPIRNLPALCRKLAQAEATPDKTVTALVMGIPNVGKSTIINLVTGRVIAKTGNEAAITKRQQRIAINNRFVLIDTPGMLWPNLENQPSAYRLAATGAIKDTALNHEDIALFIADFMLTHYAEVLKTRFRLETLPPSPERLVETIGAKRGCLGPGGIVNQDKAAKIIINEFRTGLFGNLSLETPEVMLQELEQLEILRQQKLAAAAGEESEDEEVV